MTILGTQWKIWLNISQFFFMQNEYTSNPNVLNLVHKRSVWIWVKSSNKHLTQNLIYHKFYINSDFIYYKFCITCNWIFFIHQIFCIDSKYGTCNTKSSIGFWLINCELIKILTGRHLSIFFHILYCITTLDMIKFISFKTQPI